MRCKTFQKPLALLLSAALVLELMPVPAMAEVLPFDQEDVLEVVDEQNPDEGAGEKQESSVAGESVQEETSTDIDKDGQPADSAEVHSSDGATVVTQEEGAELAAQTLPDGEVGLRDSIGIEGNQALDTSERYTIVGGPEGWTHTSETVIFTPIADGTRQSHEGAYYVVTDPNDHTVLNGLTYEENGHYWSLPEGRYTMTFDVNGTPYTTGDSYEDSYVIGYNSFKPILFNSYYGSEHADDFVITDYETGDRLTTVDTAKDIKINFVFDTATELAYDGTAPYFKSITLFKTDASAETLAQQMISGDFSSWPSQLTWSDTSYTSGQRSEVTVYPVEDMETDYQNRYSTNPPDKHATVKIGHTNLAYAYGHPARGVPNKYNQLTSGQYFPVVRYEVNGEDYIYVYNPITIEATQPADAKAPTIITPSLDSVMVNGTYTATLEGKTGSPDASKPGAMSWSITEGELPAGLVLDGNTGKISGMPAASGTYPFTVTLTEVLGDGEPRSSSRALSIRVLDEVALGEIGYDHDPIWVDGTQHQVEVWAPVTVDLTDPEYKLQGSKAWVVIHQSNDKGPLQDIRQPLTLSDQQFDGYGIVQAEATAVTGIEVRLELRDNNGNPLYRSTPDGGREPFVITATVDNPNIPFGGQATFPKLDLKSSDEPVESARVRVWPDGQDPTEDNTSTDDIDTVNGCEFSLAEGSYVFTIEAAVGQTDSWVDIMGSSEMGKLVEGTNPKQYRFSVVRGKTTAIDATFSAEKIAYHNATVLFEDEFGDYKSDLCSWYNVEWYRRAGGKDVLVGTGKTVVLEQTDDPLYVRAIPDGYFSATWEASPLVEANDKVVTVKVPRRPHFDVEATLAFASDWDWESSGRLGVIEVARPRYDTSSDTNEKDTNEKRYETYNVWVYENPVMLEGLTPGTVLTYTPADESMCRSVSYTVKDETDDRVTLTAPLARGIVTFEGLSLVKAKDVNSMSEESDEERSLRTDPIALNYWGTKVQVTKGEGDAQQSVKFYIADDSHLRILDDEANLVPGAKYNITVTINDYNGTYYPFCSSDNGYAASETFTATLKDNGDYLASETIAETEIEARGACAITFVKRSDNYVDLFLYDAAGNRLANGWWSSNGERRYRTPFLPAGNYKLYAVDDKAIAYDRFDETKTAAGLVALVGSDERTIKSVNITINNNEMGDLKDDFVLPVGTGRGLVDTTQSMVTAEGSYGDRLTIRLHAEMLAKELIKDNAYIEFYTNQPSGNGEDGFTNPQALSINGKAIAINRWERLFDGSQNMSNGTLRVRLDEARKQSEACGEFPMDMTLVIPRVNTDKTEVWAWLVSDGERSLIGYYDEIPEDVSITAPVTVAWKTFSVHGMARLNSAVDICVDGMLVAQAWADEYGFFTSEITLPDDVEDGDEFAVTATTTWKQGGVEHTATSEAQDVTYSTTEPAVERITMFYQDSVNGPYHAVKLYDRGALSSKYLGIYRPGYEDASNQMHYVFMAEIVNPKQATDVTINVVRSDGDLELETKTAAKDIAAMIPDVQRTLDLRSGLRAMASYSGSVQRNACGDVIVDALDRGTAFVTDPVILSYAPEEVYVTFDDVLLEPQIIDPLESLQGFKSAGVTAQDLSECLTYLNRGKYLKIINATDDGNEMTLADTSEAGVQGYLSQPDGCVDEWLAVSTGTGDDGWVKVHHVTTVSDASSSNATRAISTAQTAIDKYHKQLWDGAKEGKQPDVTYNSGKVIGVADHYDNDPSYVYYIATQDGAGAKTDSMYKNRIGTTGRYLYTRIVADRGSYTRTEWDESTGRCTVISYTIDSSQQQGSMDLYGMIGMWHWVLSTVSMGFEETANLMGMTEEERNAIIGVLPQAEGETVDLTAQAPALPKKKSVSDHVWEAFGFNTMYDGMTPEEVNYIKALLFDGSGDAKSMEQYYAEQGSAKKGSNYYEQLNWGWGIWGLKGVTEAVVDGTNPPKKAELALKLLKASAGSRRKKGEVQYTPAFRRVIAKLKKDKEKAEKNKEFSFPDLPDLPPEKPKPKSKPKTKTTPTPTPKPKTKSKAKNPTRGKNANKANAKRNAGKGAKIKWDPSGIVYEAVLSNPVEGATVQLYNYDTKAQTAVFFDSTKFGVEPNPQTTGTDGHYEWYVPGGWWQVRASKEGYSSFSTGDVNVGRNYGIDATRDLDNDGVDEAAEYWMPVLPIQLDVNLPLVSKAKPTVKAIDGDVEGVVVEFSKYMKPETVTAGLFTVAGKVPSKIDAVNAEEAGDGTKAADGTPVKYASKFKLYYPAGTKLKPGKHKVEVTMTDTGAKAKSYADATVDKLPYKGEVEFVIGQETQVMYRLYNPNSGEHFYTASEKERDSVVAAGWKYEGIGWVAPAESSVPVYRLYSGTDHHYTMDKSESDWLQSVGWKYEGIGWYSDEDETVPLWREFNPNVDPSAPRNNSGSHNYTTSKSEHDHLCSIGWKGEGIGWYAVAEGTPA